MLNNFLFRNYLVLFTLAFFISCQEKKEQGKVEIAPGYEQEINAYRTQLSETRKKNYLPLIALIRMDSSNLKFGGDKQHNLFIEGDSIPQTLGTFVKNDSIFRFESDIDNVVKNRNDSIVKNIYLSLDTFGSSETLAHNNIAWQVITRNEKPYLRVWDYNSKEITDFKGFENYPINEKFILKGDLKYFPKTKLEEVDSQLGPKTSTEFIGKISFKFHDKEYSLDFGEGGFLMVSDETSGSETYGGGRYMYIDLPKNDLIIKLDFNKLYNPPCAFNKFTTCLYPPRQNEMPFKIEAGEKLIRN